MTTKIENDKNVTEHLIERCSNLHEVQSLTAWLLRFITFLQLRMKDSALPSAFTNTLTVKELHNAEIALIRYAQLKQFLYHSGKQTGNHKAKLLSYFAEKLHPVIVNNVAQVGDRVNQNFKHFDSHHPTILPQHSHFMELITHHYHPKLDIYALLTLEQTFRRNTGL